MCELIGHKNVNIFTNAQKFIGSILLTNNLEVANKVLFEGTLEKVTNTLYSASTQIIKEGLWLLSNIAAFSAPHARAIVSSSAFSRVVTCASSYSIDV